MILTQGSTYKLNVPLTKDGTNIDVELVDIVEFMFQDVRKLYGSDGDVTYDNDNKVFIIPLSQKETFQLTEEGRISYQARIKYKDGEVKATPIQYGYISESLSKKVL
jgi:hypothetical protein